MSSYQKRMRYTRAAELIHQGYDPVAITRIVMPTWGPPKVGKLLNDEV